MSDRAALPDDELALCAADGDTRAFAALMTRHKEGLYRFARPYVGNSDDAYDIAQQSFIAAWGALDRYDPTRRFDTWLRAIALNKCRDHARRAAVRRLLMVPQDVASDPVRDAEAAGSRTRSWPLWMVRSQSCRARSIRLAGEVDALTGLANRGAFQLRLDGAALRAMTESSKVGLLAALAFAYRAMA